MARVVATKQMQRADWFEQQSKQWETKAKDWEQLAKQNEDKAKEWAQAAKQWEQDARHHLAFKEFLRVVEKLSDAELGKTVR